MVQMTLSERQKLILGLVVQEFVDSAQPIGSNKLVKKYQLNMSSATIRNEMGFLSESGYLRQPYTSAGRIPTEDAYRFFVAELMKSTELPISMQDTITHQFYQAGNDTTHWMRLAASVLAHQANAAAIVTSPRSQVAKIKQVQFISTTGRQFLMVLVMEGGKVSQQMLILQEPVTQDQLTEAANRLNPILAGLEVDKIEPHTLVLSPLENDLFKLTIAELIALTNKTNSEVFQDGWTNMLAEPEFAETENARKALRILEERPMLESLLSQTVMGTDIGGVQVLIGGEGNWEELSDCSLVLARYGVPNYSTGILGVLGPIRMSYSHAISTVNFVADILSNMISEAMIE
jgi:heat-inducible transcriptional repressor